jgi:hypothetical protein
MRTLKELENFDAASEKDLRVFSGLVISISDKEIVVTMNKLYTKGWRKYIGDPDIFREKAINMAGDKFVYCVSRAGGKIELTLRRENDSDIRYQRRAQRYTPRVARVG